MVGIVIQQYEQQHTPQGAMLPTEVARPGAAIGEAVAGFGRAVSGFANDMDQIADRKAKVESARLLAEAELSLQEGLMAGADGLGETDPTGFAGKFNEGAGKVRDKLLEKAGDNPHLSGYLKLGYEELQRKSFMAAMKVEREETGKFIVRQVTDLADANVKLVIADPSRVGELIAKTAEQIDAVVGVPAEWRVEAKGKSAAAIAAGAVESLTNTDPFRAAQILKDQKHIITASLSADQYSSLLQKAQGAEQAAWGNHAARRIELGEKSMDELKAVENDLIADDGMYSGKMRPADNTAMLSRVRAAKDRLTAKWEQASVKRDASAKRVLDQYQQVYSSGFPVGDALREQARQATKGTEYEQAFVDAMANESAVGEMLKKPVSDQQSYIVQRERELRTGKVNDPKEISRFNAEVTAFQRNIKAMAETPMEWNETRTGESVQRISTHLLIDPVGKDLADIMADRLATLDATSRQFGVNVNSPLFREEADQLGAVIKAQSPTKRAEMLGAMAKAIDDTEVFKGAVRQMLGDDPRAFAAGLAHGMNLTTSEGRKVGELIEQGSVILKDKSVIVPKSGQSDDGSRAAFNAYIGDALPLGSADRETYYQSALAVYAKIAADEGKLGRALDEKMFQRASRIAVGGLVEYRGQSFVPPQYGMDEDKFADAMNAALLRAAQQNGITPNNLLQSRLVPDDAVPGRYFVKQDAFNFQRDKNGNALFIEVR